MNTFSPGAGVCPLSEGDRQDFAGHQRHVSREGHTGHVPQGGIHVHRDSPQ